VVEQEWRQANPERNLPQQRVSDPRQIALKIPMTILSLDQQHHDQHQLNT
jgi:hypothetical protein